MRLNGHLHMWSVVVCSTRKARSNGCCLVNHELYKGEDWFQCHNYCVSNVMAGGSFVIVSASKTMITVGHDFKYFIGKSDAINAIAFYVFV
eukprot:scaffold5171_cov22-Cyclotella_meneghiniana.AAC.1